MIDSIAILISCGGLIYALWRAIRLDKTHPWFTELPVGDGANRQVRRPARR